MRTQIRGKDAPWPPAVWELWREKVDTPEFEAQLAKEGRTVSMSNYFTPRPFVDEYNRGSDKEGFTFVVGREVYVSEWTSNQNRAP